MGIYGTEIERGLEETFVHQMMGIYGTERVRTGACSSAAWDRDCNVRIGVCSSAG